MLTLCQNQSDLNQTFTGQSKQKEHVKVWFSFNQTVSKPNKYNKKSRKL